MALPIFAQALHEEMDRLLKENTGLREERAKQEHKIQQIIKSASRAKARLLALKTEKSREECGKEGDGRRAELEDLERQLATLKDTFLCRQEQQQREIAELSEALSASRKTEGMWIKRAQDLRAEVVKGLQAREIAAMQVSRRRRHWKKKPGASSLSLQSERTGAAATKNCSDLVPRETLAVSISSFGELSLFLETYRRLCCWSSSQRWSLTSPRQVLRIRRDTTLVLQSLRCPYIELCSASELLIARWRICAFATESRQNSCEKQPSVSLQLPSRKFTSRRN